MPVLQRLMVVVVLLVTAVPASAQRSIEAVRLEPGERIQLDGKLDEGLWQRITPATDFVQREPVEGGSPTERTEVRVAYDEGNLYLGVILFDSDPTGIIGHQKQRNAGLGTDDRFMWILDTFRDGRTGYFFETNPAGLMGDGLMSSGSGVNKSWNGIWFVKVARGDYGWSAEIRIPFSTLNFNPQNESWGINFQRTVRRKNEEILWSGHRRNQGLSPAHAGLLTGLRGISQGIGLEVKPYVVGSGSQTPRTGSGEWDTPFNAGFDLNYSVTPSLRAALSINTDFAEVEVDQRRVNLTRFPLRFPEQRDFFLEGSGVFNFAPGNGVEPYFSRRIGLVGGMPTPIRYGARMTGQAGEYDLGVIQVRTGELDGIPAENFTVARVVRNIFRQSAVGLIATRRGTEDLADIALSEAQHTVGADLELTTSRFLGDRNVRFQAFYVWHDPRDQDTTSSWMDRGARGVRLAFPNDVWSGHISYRELGNSFNPAVGFVPRRGFRRLQPSLQFSPRPANLPQVRRFDFGLRGEYLTDMAGNLQTGSFGLGVLGVRFESGDQISLDYDRNFERLQREFRLHPDTMMNTLVAAGGYDFGGWELSGNTAGRRRISGAASIGQGSFWSGDRTQYGASVTLRARPGVSFSSGVERNSVQLPDQRFVTDLIRFAAGWHATPATSVTGNVQYDNVSNMVGLNTRFRWIIRPGSDLFLVYSHNMDRLEGQFETLQRSATTKLTYTHRF
ncbi:hypothetical protein BH23GEM6_BH23GEM6_09310 [soil metagenome]